MNELKAAPQWKRHAPTVALITLCYILFGLLVSFYNYSILANYGGLESYSEYDPRLDIFVNTLISLIAGIFGGSGAIWLNQNLFRNKSYGYSLLATFILFSALFICITVIAAIATTLIRSSFEVSGREIGNEIIDFVFDPLTATFFIIWSSIAIFTLFLIQVNDKFGPGVLKKFLLGKYHSPREEERIFMFLDMRSSTTIAEKLGNTAYFNLLASVFSDITPAIVRCKGEIYQYVGDEVVISWEIPSGVQDANCIRCYYAIQQELQALSETYQRKFGIVPEFKAGIHHGSVTAGEVGRIKRDIVYSGDVLNTTSRIQEHCKKLGASLLISEQTFTLISPGSPFQASALGQISLRGKQEVVDLYSIQVPNVA